MRRYALPPFAAAAINRVAWLVLAALFLYAAAARADAGPTPKYVFLFIGDGLAMPQRSAAEYCLAAKDGSKEPGIVKLAMNKMPASKIVNPSSSSNS